MDELEDKAAQWIHWISVLAIVLAFLVFLAFGLGILPSFVGPEDVAARWGLSVQKLRDTLKLSFEQGWFLHGQDGYMASSAALALVASAALPALVMLSVQWFLRKDWVYGLMASSISAILIFAVLR